MMKKYNAHFWESDSRPGHTNFITIMIEAPTLREAWKQARAREIRTGDEVRSVREIEAGDP